MKKRGYVLIGLLVLTTIFSSKLKAQPGTSASDPMACRFGAQQISVQSPDNVSEAEWQQMQEKVMHELRGNGIGWGRFLSRWDVIRGFRDRPEGYDFVNSDLATGAAVRAGIALVGLLTNRKGSGGAGQSPEPLTDRDEFMEYVRTTVERYDGDSDLGLPEGHSAFPNCDKNGDGKITEEEKAEWGKTHRIHCWELVKEPVPPGRRQAKPGGQSGGVTAQQVVEILEAGWTAIKKADPNALVLFGGLAPGPVGGLDVLKTYLNEILSAGGARYFDVVGIDAFTHPPDQIIEIHREIMQSHGLKKPFWVIQTGTNAVGPGRTSREGGTPAKQAAYVVKALVRSFAAGADKVFWGDFMYRTDEADPSNVWHDYGLLHYDAVHKRPGFYTYALLISKINGFTSAQKLSEGQYSFQFAGKPPVFVLWKEGERETVDLSAQLKTDQAVVTHIIDEKDKTVPLVERFPATAVPVSERPVFVEAS